MQTQTTSALYDLYMTLSEIELYSIRGANPFIRQSPHWRKVST